MQLLCEHITGDINIYLHGCVSLVPPEYVVCFCVCVCVISNQSTTEKPHYTPDLSKIDTLLHKIDIKVLLVPRYQGLTRTYLYYH